MLTYSFFEEDGLIRYPCSSMSLMDKQLGSGSCSGPGPAESGLCCLLVLQQNTHRALSVNNDGGEQSEILISPLSFCLAAIFPTQRAYTGRDSLISVLTLIHAAEVTSTSATHTLYLHLERKHKSSFTSFLL